MQSPPISCEESLGGSLSWADLNRTGAWSGRPFGAFGGSASLERRMPRVARSRWKQEPLTEQHYYWLLNNYSRVVGLAVDGHLQRSAVLKNGDLRTDYGDRFQRSHHGAKGEGRSGQPC